MSRDHPLLPTAENIAAVVRYMVEWSQSGDARLGGVLATDVLSLLREAEQAGSPPAQSHRRLVDAATLARQMGRTPEWVRKHKQLLGGVPMGDGPRPRWAFDPVLAKRRLTAGSTTGEAVASAPEPVRRGTRSRDSATAAHVPLLPIKGNG